MKDQKFVLNGTQDSGNLESSVVSTGTVLKSVCLLQFSLKEEPLLKNLGNCFEEIKWYQFCKLRVAWHKALNKF